MIPSLALQEYFSNLAIEGKRKLIVKEIVHDNARLKVNPAVGKNGNRRRRMCRERPAFSRHNAMRNVNIDENDDSFDCPRLTSLMEDYPEVPASPRSDRWTSTRVHRPQLQRPYSSDSKLIQPGRRISDEKLDTNVSRWCPSCERPMPPRLSSDSTLMCPKRNESLTEIEAFDPKEHEKLFQIYNNAVMACKKKRKKKIKS